MNINFKSAWDAFYNQLVTLGGYKRVLEGLQNTLIIAIVGLVIGIVLGTALIWFTFRLNARYGVHGLMKVAAARSFPRRIINRKRISRLLKIKTDIYEKHT